nr:predicted GPI-anchored protein 58 [Lolium perenne]
MEAWKRRRKKEIRPGRPCSIASNGRQCLPLDAGRKTALPPVYAGTTAHRQPPPAPASPAVRVLLPATTCSIPPQACSAAAPSAPATGARPCNDRAHVLASLNHRRARSAPTRQLPPNQLARATHLRCQFAPARCAAAGQPPPPSPSTRAASSPTPAPATSNSPKRTPARPHLPRSRTAAPAAHPLAPGSLKPRPPALQARSLAPPDRLWFLPCCSCSTSARAPAKHIPRSTSSNSTRVRSNLAQTTCSSSRFH